MALELAFEYLQQNYCHELVLTDSSGEYSNANPTGWTTATNGGNTIQIDNESVIESYLQIVKPDGTEKIINLLNVATWQDITPYTGVNDAPFDASVTPDNLSYTLDEDYLGTISDGIWTIKYVVRTAGVTAQTIFTVALFGNVECCMYKMVDLSIDHYECDKCDNVYLHNITVIWALYLNLLYAARLANIERFNRILLALQKIFLAHGCTTCS
jgi:hypothetical protein